MKNYLHCHQGVYSRFQQSFKCLLLPVALFILFLSNVHAQDKSIQSKDYSTEPVWIKMMDDQNVNYFEARKAFDEYWKHHVKPAGEEEEMSEGQKDSREIEKEKRKNIAKDKKKKVSEEDLKKMNENIVMKYQVKRFEQWTREVKPYVQDDGRILNDLERMEIWKKQQEEMKKQQK